jgi:hypothetical protein
VSQSPFIVTLDERVYFVSRDTETALDATAVSEDPDVAAVWSFREGTYVAAASQVTPATDEELEAIAVLVPAAEERSAVTTVDRLRAVDASLVVSKPETAPAPDAGGYRFSVFHHPYACRFIEEVRRNGVFGLLDPDPQGVAGDLFRQKLSGDPDDFENRYDPTGRVAEPYPFADIDFSVEGAYAQYNWEVFFHIPFYLADRLADAGRFQEAFDWLHTIFDPRTRTSASASGVSELVEQAQWWKVRPFLEPASQPVTDWIAFTGADGDVAAQAAFEAQVAAWREEPFNPHRLARLRPGTYPRAVVMKYVDTLIAWADHLFTKDTLETINEAIQLYVFAKQVLGDRPELIDDVEPPTPKTWNELVTEASIDPFGNPLVALENASFNPTFAPARHTAAPAMGGLGMSPYFCVPYNPKLLSYWDVLEDRLFKVRNGLNIAGVARSLPLFQPPIDPAMLVRAASSGVDLAMALSDTAAVGPYRFSVMLGRAQALAGSVRGLGQALLSALEKRDGEALALLRQQHEAAVLDAVRGVRERQIDEAQEALAGLKESRRAVAHRIAYYQGLIDQGWNAEETVAAAASAVATVSETVAAVLRVAQAVAAAVPQFSLKLPFPAVETESGGTQAAAALGANAGSFEVIAAGSRGVASYLSVTAGYKRRSADWAFQVRSAERELAAMHKQIAGAEIRLDIARQELRNHDLQVRHSAEVREWMERKFTNQDLYDWMVGQLAALHFQTWQVAYAAAKKAEACYNHELGRTDTFVQAVHWDGTRRGLLAGERLAHDLERMDVAYLDLDAREHELTKTVSLRLLDPLALERLRADGECFFEVPEAHFDLDCPSHYFRRIQSVALSIACVAGPQGNVSTRLTLHGSRLRTAPDTLGEWATSTYPSVVTSVATQDAGVFSLDPKDARYLPFERVGAISRWHLKLTARTIKQLDWAAIEDVALYLRYTARDDGTDRVIDATALESLQVGLDADFGDAVDTGFVRLVSLKRDFAEDLVSAQQTNDTSVAVLIAKALRDPVTTQDLVGILAVPIAASGASPPPSLGLDHVSAAEQTFGTGVSYHHWTGGLPDLDSTITLAHGSETSREAPVIGILADPPPSPADGDRYLVEATASGDWAGEEAKIAQYDESETMWVFTTPTTGMAVYVQEEGVVYIYGVTWAVAEWNFNDVDDIVLVLLYR